MSCRRRRHPGAVAVFRRLLIPFAATSLLSPAHADQVVAPTGPAVELAPITVRASPLGRTADQLVQPVTVLSGEELNAHRRPTIGETLEQQPGVSTTDFGPGAGRPVIRGEAGPRVEVLENGLSALDVSDVSPDHAVAINPASATQIEILKGPATLLYGSGASGGVVNVSNDRLPARAEQGLRMSMDVGGGNNGEDRGLSGDFNYGLGAHQLHADVGQRSSRDYRIPDPSNSDGSGAAGRLPNSATDTTTGALGYGYVHGGDVFALAGSDYRSRYGLPVESTAFIDMQQQRIDGLAQFNRPFAGAESLRLRAAAADYQHTEFEDVGVPGTTFSNRASQQRVELVHRPLWGLRGVVGVQNSYRDFSADGEEVLVHAVTTRQTGLFVVEETRTAFGTLEAGLRIEHLHHSPGLGQDGPERDFTPLSGSLGALWGLGPNSHLKLTATHSERAPVAEELYAFGPHGATATYERGDTALRSEAANNIDLGFDHHDGRLHVETGLFYNRVQRYVYASEVDQGLNADGSGTAASDGVADRVDAQGRYDAAGELLLVDYRQASATLYGAEAAVSYRLQQGAFSLTPRLFADTVRGEIDGGGNLPRMTPSRVGLAIDVRRGPYSGSLAYTRVQRQTRIAALETTTAGYNHLSADLTYKPAVAGGSIEFYLRGRNLLDQDERRATSFIKDAVPLPGRSFYTGVRFEID